MLSQAGLMFYFACTGLGISCSESTVLIPKSWGFRCCVHGALPILPDFHLPRQNQADANISVIRTQNLGLGADACMKLVERIPAGRPPTSGDRRGRRARVHLHRQRPLHRATDAARLQGQARVRGAPDAQPGTGKNSCCRTNFLAGL